MNLETVEGAAEWVERNVLPALQTEPEEFRPFALVICRLGDDLEALAQPRLMDVTCSEVEDAIPSTGKYQDEALVNFSAWVRAALSTYAGVGVIVCCRVTGHWNNEARVSNLVLVTLEHEQGDRAWYARVDRGGIEPFSESQPGSWQGGLLSRMMPKRWLN